MMKRPTFFVKRSARLAARLQLMTWCWRFARQIEGRVIVLWPPLPASSAALDGLEYSPAMIFDLPRFYTEGGAEELVFIEGRVAEQHINNSVSDERYAIQRRDGFDTEHMKREAQTYLERRPITGRFHHEPKSQEHLRTSLRQTWARLPYHPAIVRSLEAIRPKIGAGYLALHVRRGDVIDALRNELPIAETLSPAHFSSLLRAYASRVSPLESYYAPVEAAIDGKQPIVFFSDSPEISAHFTKKFGVRPFVLSDRFAQGRPPIQKAFIDFNLMVEAQSIVSTSSIYSHFAATLGSNRLLNVVGNSSSDTITRELFDVHLAGLPICGQTRSRVEAELERQHKEVVAEVRGEFLPPPLPIK